MTVINKPQKPLLGKVRITAELVAETGLHIGSGSQTLDIGGVDKPVIRDPITRRPYLPGSSIKGKLRAILERFLGKPLNRQGSRDTFRYESDDVVDGFTETRANTFIPFDGAQTCTVSRIFGSTGAACWVPTEIANTEQLDKYRTNEGVRTATLTHPNNGSDLEYTKVKGRNFPARLIVRDCHLHHKSVEILENLDTGIYMTELKFENGIDRITAAANPRQLERVPAGATFKFEMVYTVEDSAQVEEDLKNLAIALAILEDDALGGHGSRGYGKVRFDNFQFFYRGIEQYQNVGLSASNLLTPFYTRSSDPDDPNHASATAALLSDFGTLSNQMNAKLLPGTGDNDETE